MTIPTFYLSINSEKFENSEDALKASVFSLPQKAMLTNQMRLTIEEKVNMAADTENYLLKQEFCRGQITILAYLISVSDASEEQLNQN